MRMVLAAASLAALCGSAQAANLSAVSTIDAVTVFPDGASVVRVIKLDLPAGDSSVLAADFPPGLDPSSLRVEGEAGARLTIGAIDAKPPRAEPPANLPELEQKIEALKDQRAAIQGAIAAAEARRKFALRFAEQSPAGLGEKGEARPMTEWRAAFAAVAEEVANAETAIREAGYKQRDIDRQIARLEAEKAAKPPRKMEVRIDLAAAAATKATLRVTYSVANARWLALYDARLDTGARDRKPSLELVRRAEILQHTGEDWQDVALAVSTVRTARGGNAPDLHTLRVYFPEPRPQPAGSMLERSDKFAAPAAPAPRAAMRAAPPVSAAVAAEEQQAEAQVSGFQVVFKIPGRVSVSAVGGAKNLRIGTATHAPELAVRAVPSIDPTGYLEASFKQSDDAPLLAGRVSIYRDGVFVGRGAVKSAAKGETVRLGFGADEKIKLEYNTVKRTEGTAGFIVGASKTDERLFKISVRNGHDFPIKLAVEDRLPVSENEDIQVEMLPATTPPTATNLRDRRGVVEWAFELKPDEARDIAFGWRVKWPKDKSVVMTP